MPHPTESCNPQRHPTLAVDVAEVVGAVVLMAVEVAGVATCVVVGDDCVRVVLVVVATVRVVRAESVSVKLLTVVVARASMRTVVVVLEVRFAAVATVARTLFGVRPTAAGALPHFVDAASNLPALAVCAAGAGLPLALNTGAAPSNMSSASTPSSATTPARADAWRDARDAASPAEAKNSAAMAPASSRATCGAKGIGGRSAAHTDPAGGLRA